MTIYHRGGKDIQATQKEIDEGILLWEAPLAKAPEACAELSYKDQKYLIPYTLMNWITGWVAVGMHGTFAPYDACTNIACALKDLEKELSIDSMSMLENSQTGKEKQ